MGGAALKLKPSKCVYAKRGVNYLECEVSAAGIHPGPAKTDAASSYPAPKDAKELRHFLGLLNYTTVDL